MVEPGFQFRLTSETINFPGLALRDLGPGHCPLPASGPRQTMTAGHSTCISKCYTWSFSCIQLSGLRTLVPNVWLSKYFHSSAIKAPYPQPFSFLLDNFGKCWGYRTNWHFRGESSAATGISKWIKMQPLLFRPLLSKLMKSHSLWGKAL